MASTIEAAEVRTDRAPIEERFPLLGEFVDAHWVGGRLGDDSVPGPSTYFIEAVVTLVPDDLARLTTEHSFAPAQTAPAPPPSLAPLVSTAADWSSSTELDQVFGPSDWASTVYLHRADGVAYISARGE